MEIRSIDVDLANSCRTLEIKLQQSCWHVDNQACMLKALVLNFLLLL